MNDMVKVALLYIAQGFKVFPVKPDKKPLTQHGFKDATQTEAVVREYWTRWPDAGIALVTNGLIVLDFDAKNSGLESKTAMEKKYGSLPSTRTHRTGGGGEHWIYRNPNGADLRNTVALAEYRGVDLRANGGYIVAPPSLHQSGRRYEVLDDSEIAPAPIWLLDLVTKKRTRSQQTATDSQPIVEGQRNSALTSLAGTMRRRGMAQESIETALQDVNKRQCSPPLPDEEVTRIAQSVTRYEPELSPGQPESATVGGGFNLTDMGNAERLVSRYGKILHYCYERKRWLVWDGKAWEWDAGNKVAALAKLAVRKIYHEAGNEADEKKRKGIASHAAKSESDPRLTGMINLAQSEPNISIKLTDLDTNQWLFNCLNGAVDLRSGELLPHRKEDLMTVLVPIEYNPNARCDLWMQFMERVTGSNIDLITYLQRAVGYSLTGDTRSQTMFFLYGLGSNGKSTFITLIRKLTGGYGAKANTSLFMTKDKNSGGPSEDLANLQGKRFVTASEIEDGRRLAVVLIKEMTGGEAIRADRKYEHEIEFQPVHKIWLVGNHKPVITDTTLSIWRRVKLIPFTVTIANEEIDPNLPAKLESELPGILVWAVRGCLEWQRCGLGEPKAVTNATSDYRHEQDILGDFIDDYCLLKTTAAVPKHDLKTAYEEWCNSTGSQPVSQKTFRARLIERGITEGKSGSTRYWRGVVLLKAEGQQGQLGQEGQMGQEIPGNLYMKENQENFSENPVPSRPDVPTEDIPDYPCQPCLACGCDDYWLTDQNQWLCSQCHPNLEGNKK